MVNQLFCLTQSAGSASQPARLNWGAGGGGGGGVAMVVFGERERERASNREMRRGTNGTLADTSAGMSEELESWKLVSGEARSGEEVGEATQVEATVAERAHYFITSVTTQKATQLEE